MPIEVREPIESRRARARSRQHLMLHQSLCDSDVRCPGCLAKTRDKSHFRHMFDRKDDRYKDTVTLDQTGMGANRKAKRSKDKKLSDDPTDDRGIGNYR